MIRAARAHIGHRLVLVVCTTSWLVAACTSGDSTNRIGSEGATTKSPGSTARAGSGAARAGSGTTPATPKSSVSRSRPAGEFTISFAGDVHFATRVGKRLARDPSTVFAQAAPGLAKADLTMVNLETAITTGGDPQHKSFTFRAPPSAFTALRDAGIDVATMANNHGADYGASGLSDTLAAIEQTRFPVVGIGADAAQAYAPYTTTLHGTRVAIIAADQVRDETTLRLFSAGDNSPGVANAYSSRLITAVQKAKAAGYLVVVYLHWGIEYQTCPSSNQTELAARLGHAGATAVIGTHAHVLQGEGYGKDGTYVAYGLGNYLWWLSFGNNQDDNGVLTLTFRDGRVAADSFAPSHLDDRGVPVPATGQARSRILAELDKDRQCTELSASPPG